MKLDLITTISVLSRSNKEYENADFYSDDGCGPTCSPCSPCIPDTDCPPDWICDPQKLCAPDVTK